MSCSRLHLIRQIVERPLRSHAYSLQDRPTLVCTYESESFPPYQGLNKSSRQGDLFCQPARSGRPAGLQQMACSCSARWNPGHPLIMRKEVRLAKAYSSVAESRVEASPESKTWNWRSVKYQLLPENSICGVSRRFVLGNFPSRSCSASPLMKLQGIRSQRNKPREQKRTPSSSGKHPPPPSHPPEAPPSNLSRSADMAQTVFGHRTGTRWLSRAPHQAMSRTRSNRPGTKKRVPRLDDRVSA